ncbi:MAG: hypothetical protein WA943_07535 [Parvibaculum sp.]|uniref:hypothetical protein n=1 Tax=Parvibaculum sp. TaxID=2024848 RepID=UPI003C787EBF
MHKWMALAALLMMTACVSPEQQAAMNAAQQQADARECQNYGFKPGTESFGNCMLKLKEIRAQEANTEEIRRASIPSPWWPYGPYGPYGPRGYW